MNKILVVGGANIEYILKSPKPIIKGSKNFVEVEELFGGSGLNYTVRLLSYGKRVIPLLFVGEDSVGEDIYDKIIKLGASDLNRDVFFVPTLSTPRSTIIVEGHQRTILAQDLNDTNIFQSFVKNRLKYCSDITTVIIGHIHNDRRDINKSIYDLTTSYVIDFYRDKSIFLYANLGASQLEYGFEFWREYLQKLDILQLNIHELSTFIEDGKKLSLYDLIKKIFELKISAIITLDQFGAIGIYRGDKDRLILARAITDMEDFVDSTGAGDAFCSGVVSYLDGNRDYSLNDFKEAMGVGRSWASYACRSYGGANNLPNRDKIDIFHQKVIKDNEVMIYEGESIKDITTLLDSMLNRI